MIRVAFGSVPKDGGTFTFYRNQRPALLEQEVDMRCVTLGPADCALWEDAYADEGCVRVGRQALSLKAQARAFVQWCEAERIDIVMGINSAGILSAIPHLPPEIHAVSRCANGFDHGYRITLSGYERLERIVALTPRLRDTLIADYGVERDRIALIPNGINPEPFERAATEKRGQCGPLMLGFLGRLEHNQKGVLHLSNIVNALKSRGVDFRLRIAGKGRHEPELRESLNAEIASGEVEMLGALSPGQIPDFLARTDVFLFTSHFEGCPNALLEAIMAGAVPVSWRIDGTTDFIIDDGETGFLCDSGDVEGFADRIAQLAGDRNVLRAMSAEAARNARRRFTSDLAARAYATLFSDIVGRPVRSAPAVPWRDFVPDPNFAGAWRRLIPENVKRPFRGWRVR